MHAGNCTPTFHACQLRDSGNPLLDYDSQSGIAMQTSDAAQGGDGQEGRHVEHHVCASDAADVALLNVRADCRVRLCDASMSRLRPPSQAGYGG